MATHDNKITWPFANATDGRLLFGPLGRYGTRYIVPEGAPRVRIANNCRFAISGFTLSVGLLRMINDIREANGLAPEQRVIADNNTFLLTLIPIALAVWFVYYQAEALTIAVKRPSLRDACAMFATRWKPFQIWIVQELAILLATFSAFQFANPHNVNKTIGLIQDSTLFGIGISVALFCCYLLSIRNLPKADVLARTGKSVRPNDSEHFYGKCDGESQAVTLCARQIASRQALVKPEEFGPLTEMGREP